MATKRTSTMASMGVTINLPIHVANPPWGVA